MTPLDAFYLPDWLGEGEVIWTSDDSTRSGSSVAGCLAGPGDQQHPCDLLAVDLAYPAPVVDDKTSTAAHQAWMHGQVLLLDRDGRAVEIPRGPKENLADRVWDLVVERLGSVSKTPDTGR